jgi:hypothetical protein
VKTLLFCTIYADRQAGMERLAKWLAHHARITYPCEVQLAAIGDGIADSIAWPTIRGEHAEGLLGYHAVNLEPHLGRPNHLHYPGWWRSFTHSLDLARANGCRRIWHVESDFFLASQRMVERMHELVRGWSAFWCPLHNFPETAVQVICEDKFRELEAYKTRRRQMEGRHAEGVLPLNNVFRDMVGDRYGEAGILPDQVPGLDYYGQVAPATPMLFRAAR